MKQYMIWYQKPHEVADSYFERDIYVSELTDTHAFVATIEAENLERVFFMMNDPYGEGLNPLATEIGQRIVVDTEVLHTSMSVNDVVLDVETGIYYRVAGAGFVKLINA